MEKIKIYLIARISKDAHSWNNKISSSLNSNSIKIFKPHEHNPWNLEHKKFEKEVFETDLAAIKKSHIGLCLPEFGNDCSWECGWYSNSKKPLVAFVDQQTSWLRDWMIKGGINHVITNNQDTLKILQDDPILKHKQFFFIDDNFTLTNAIEEIYSKNYKKFINYVANLRPYSWIDLIFVGYLAKAIKFKTIMLELTDIYFIISLLAMWFFYNSLLEKKHNYDYRAKHSHLDTIVYGLIAVIISATKPTSLIFLFIAFVLNFIYLQKQSIQFLRTSSTLVRGLIHSAYFLFAISFNNIQISPQIVIYSIILCLIMTIRSLVGDLRDIKHNSKAGKKTLAVTLGEEHCETLILIGLILLFIINSLLFNGLALSMPIIIFFASVLTISNWYVLHQLAVIWTMFIVINYIALTGNLNIYLFNLIFLGLTLNLVFYPTLQRKSNPKFA